jgi:hypothetical protein
MMTRIDTRNSTGAVPGGGSLELDS